jgi:hypothetical protein
MHQPPRRRQHSWAGSGRLAPSAGRAAVTCWDPSSAPRAEPGSLNATPGLPVLGGGPLEPHIPYDTRPSAPEPSSPLLALLPARFSPEVNAVLLLVPAATEIGYFPAPLCSETPTAAHMLAPTAPAPSPNRPLSRMLGGAAARTPSGCSRCGAAAPPPTEWPPPQCWCRTALPPTCRRWTRCWQCAPRREVSFEELDGIRAAVGCPYAKQGACRAVGGRGLGKK